ncbi:stabilin-1 isoform X1 [Pygocentrus nattereri]|uniref:stabilin-1 isoform X1 n=1 Tax=Pygocentrus nattereri TaxID=42514 RepID=UPI000814A414|nr:stabilin-1 isoform X1 [Pygocentrus nattereri]
MYYLLVLGLMLCSLQIEAVSSRCDEPRVVQHSTLCTSCAAAPAIVCPRGFRKTTMNVKCRYSVEIGDRLLELPGCSRSCEKVTTIKRCCPGFWGPLCLPCPSWMGRPCNWHGTCSDGDSGNGTCACEEGYTGFACQKCTNEKAFGEHCSSVCNCEHGVCNSGPDGDGQCYCEPPYSGPKCDKVSFPCSACPANSYCKGGSVVCECLPNFKKVGQICTGICSPNVCDENAVCSYKAGQFQCACKAGYEGDGKICTPVNPCSQNNGGCPSNSTVCEYKGPGKAKCVCMSGMEGSNPAAGCTLKSACTENTCHRNAQCETGQDGIARCLCSRQQIRDGKRCYGNIMERVLELDREGSQAGKLTGTITLFEKGCELVLSKHGPFTAFVPVDTSQISVDKLNHEAAAGAICKHHLILGQHLYKDLEGQDLWTYGGEVLRFKANKQFISKRDPDTLFTIIETDIPAANGIIHIIDKAFANVDMSSNAEFSSKTIGEIIAKDERFNRFLSLVDNCGAPMPLKGPGPLTLFIPTNKAVDRFRDGSLIYMLNDAKHKLQELLKHHMFSQAAVTVDQLASMSEIQTMAHQAILINVTGDGRVLLGEKGIPLESKDIVASNGIIHLIDGVLVPPSILPIMPHRCDVNESTIIMSPCVSCPHISETQCPPGSVEMPQLVKDCLLSRDQRSDFLTVAGCAKYCNITRMRSECCRGFYGPDCKPCIGGFQHPCYDKGTCSDGINGDGTCKCNPGFKGIGCHICTDPKKHGENCDEDCRCVHGVCDNRPGSLGVCRRDFCLPGYSGELCDQVATPCDSDGAFKHCHIHAHCIYIDGQTMCVCNPGYDGDGYTCAEANLCLKPDRGGCHVNAQCVYAGPGNVSCVCNEGWTGDGILCVEVNNCLLESRGGCHEHADCIPTEPGQNECACKKGYMGDGFICQIVNPCLTDNGGCHALAACSFKGNGTKSCICPEGYKGDGMTCYSNILVALDENGLFSDFNRYLQRHPVISTDSNVTALVPLKEAFKNLSAADEVFYLDYYRLPHFLQAHFLDGIYTFEDLKKQVNKMVPTICKTKWEVTEKDGELKVGNAVIITPDIKAINGFIHTISTVLKPPVSDFPPIPPELMEALDDNPSFSLFREATLLYNLSKIIPSRGYTVFVPHNNAVQTYLEQANLTHLDADVVKYHIIPKEQLFPEHLTDGTLKSTLLGGAYQIMIHLNSKNETLVNDVPLDGNFTETRHGTIISIPRVLQIHKNHCSQDVILKVLGRCGPCDSTPKCTFNGKPIKTSFPSNMKSNCKYRTRVGKKRKSVPGCMMDCLRTTKDHSCCPGYFGHDCFKCPGAVDNWCSNNGKCQDGLFGNGECLCNEGFHGTACEMCDAGRYGKDCKSECHCEHGKCLDGLDGNGQCICYKGWKGVNCSLAVVNDECGGICDTNANCISGGSGGKPVCVCIAGYQGNGTLCKEKELCGTNNGGCSEHATCMKIAPGERDCLCNDGYTGDGIVCVELNPCLVNNGGCSENADCVKTGPNTAACVCKPGFAAQGRICSAINPCLKDNGGCNINAICRYNGPGERNCTCRYGYKGNGNECAGTVSRELLHKPEGSWLRRNLGISLVRDLFGKGPFTVFVPHTDYVVNDTQIEKWVNKSCVADLLRYHIVGCEELSESELKSVSRVVAASGHVLRFSVRDGVVYINNKTKIITSDQECSNGIIHFIDGILFPYELKDKTFVQPDLNVTTAAEAYGYTMFSKLLKQANLINMVMHTTFYPFTMFWPTDNAFNSLPDKQKKWLYSEDHRDKLQAFIKVHIVKDQRTVACALPHERYIRTMYGSKLTFSCDQSLIGDILINGNNAKIIERHLAFSSGIAYGIDKVLEPPNIGAHCDDFGKTEIKGRCGNCIFPPSCPYGSEDTNTTSFCRPPWRYRYRHHSVFDDLQHSPYDFRPYHMGCNRVCQRIIWDSQCCKNHYGRDCQVCPGGLEAPCGEHGDCDDGRSGRGTCNCHPGFNGTACELCHKNHYGPNCTACNCTIYGKCDDGLDGDGSCFCQEGWTGKRCESKIEVKPICSPECDSNAVCLLANQCECVPPYEGNGLNCTAPDLCSEYNGGCHDQADCAQTGTIVTCSCKSGYTGDGSACSPINRCVEEVNGGCSDFANCIVTGPNERRCECLPGYVGNGVQCLEKVVPPVDRCLEDNGGCDAKATCKDLHFHTKTDGVFHLRSPAGKYMMNYTTAEAACKAEGATLATSIQLSHAQQLGMHLCVAGWMDGKKVGYPIRFPSVKCGDNQVGVILYKDPVDLSSLYDAYCYRMREVTCECGPGYVGNGEFCNGNLASVVATNSNFSVFYSTLVKYAEAVVEGKNLLNFLSTRSSNATLFVPHNAGFSGNETLSWRDMEYHISSNNSLHFYEDLQHNTAIPSRLGYNLVVVITSDKTQADNIPPIKLVNKQIILDWNIPATNGLIHVIQGPLRAPPVAVTPPAPTAAHSKSSAPAVTTVLIIIFIGGVIAGVAYYFLKYRNDAFRFQYFKNDDEDSTKAGRNPAIVSIPNPLYSGYKAFAEPFGEPQQAESPAMDAAVLPNLLE